MPIKPHLAEKIKQYNAIPFYDRISEDCTSLLLNSLPSTEILFYFEALKNSKDLSFPVRVAINDNSFGVIRQFSTCFTFPILLDLLLQEEINDRQLILILSIYDFFTSELWSASSDRAVASFHTVRDNIRRLIFHHLIRLNHFLCNSEATVSTQLLWLMCRRILQPTNSSIAEDIDVIE